MSSLFSKEQSDAISAEINQQIINATTPLTSEISSLQQQLAAANKALSNATTAGTGNAKIEKEKIKEPETYKGSRDKTKSFLMQVQLVFDAQAHIYNTDAKKIRYAASFCRDSAWEWFQGHIESKTFEAAGVTYSTFTDRLLKDYGEVDTHHESLRKLRKLSQKGPCSKYTTDFNILANRTQLNDAAKMDEFRRGLKENVKDMLVNMTRPQNLGVLQQQAVDADYRIYERLSEKKYDGHVKPSNSTNTQQTHQTATGPTPMQVDAQQVGQRRGPLTAEEKQRRRDNKLCLYCGGNSCGGYPDVNGCTKAPKKKSGVGFSK